MSQTSPLNPIAQKQAAKDFIARWQEMPCVEEEHSRSFWIELLSDVLGIANPTRVLDSREFHFEKIHFASIARLSSKI